MTHVLLDGQLPTSDTDLKEVTPICSSSVKIEQGFYFKGYTSEEPLKKDRLEKMGTLYTLPSSVLLLNDEPRRRVWIGSDLKIYFLGDSDEAVAGTDEPHTYVATAVAA